jgi:hypothetical protein
MDGSDWEKPERERFELLKAELTAAFRAPEVSYSAYLGLLDKGTEPLPT